MKELPRFESYGNAKSKNYGMNSLVFYTSGGTFWFSYKTLVAFKKLGGPLFVRQNIWGPTTGRHLNLIDYDKTSRVDSEEFYKRYNEAFGGAE